MAEPGRYQLEVLVSFRLIPMSQAHASVYFKGALAAYDGKPESANPYKWRGGFKNAWARGWHNLTDGHIAIKAG